MTTSESLAAWEATLRPFVTRLPAAVAVRFYSRGRQIFLRRFLRQKPAQRFMPEGLERRLWDLRFQTPIANAAGMFKNGEGYELVAHQGAGAYLAGTTTGHPRRGNRRHGVALPFAPYPASHAASNWLGLPNDGHSRVARRLAAVERYDGCPIGASVAADPEPDMSPEDRLTALAAGMQLYEEAGVDFLEMNESCPNTPQDSAALDDLRGRLEHVSRHFLARRRRHLPVVVKFSCDAAVEEVADLVEMLVELGFDGVNFGNTSTAYAARQRQIDRRELALYTFFQSRFGGGVSGRPLREASLQLASAAVAARERLRPGHEFQVLRTGGIEGPADLAESENAGIHLCQWYTGYFEAFSRRGHRLYEHLYRQLQER